MSENEDTSFIGPMGCIEDLIKHPQRKVTLTFTHLTLGDGSMKEAMLRAMREYEFSGSTEDFTASNGVRIRASWPETQPDPDDDYPYQDYGAMYTRPDGTQSFIFVATKPGTELVFKPVDRLAVDEEKGEQQNHG